MWGFYLCFLNLIHDLSLYLSLSSAYYYQPQSYRSVSESVFPLYSFDSERTVSVVKPCTRTKTGTQNGDGRGWTPKPPLLRNITIEVTLVHINTSHEHSVSYSFPPILASYHVLPPGGLTMDLTPEYLSVSGMVMLSCAWWASSFSFPRAGRLVTSTINVIFFTSLLYCRIWCLPCLGTQSDRR